MCLRTNEKNCEIISYSTFLTTVKFCVSADNPIIFFEWLRCKMFVVIVVVAVVVVAMQVVMLVAKVSNIYQFHQMAFPCESVGSEHKT